MLNQLLHNLGHKEIETKANRTKYKSPFNIQEKTASFFTFKSKIDSIDPLKSLNFSCKSTAQGGDIYKFVMVYFNLSFPQAKIKTRELLGLDSATNAVAHSENHSFSFNQPKVQQSKNESIKLVKSQPLQNLALLAYLGTRAIPTEIAKKYLGEVYYKIEDKSYFALSFLNDVGGREIRNKYFKGSLGKKGVSFIQHSPSTKLKIFEGFIDFLSYQILAPVLDTGHFLILNSVSLREQALKLIMSILTTRYEEVHLYCDNDKAGNETTQFFMNNLGSVVEDKRQYYADFKDMNELLTNLKKG